MKMELLQPNLVSRLTTQTTASQMEVGCLWYPGASAIGSQLLDGDGKPAMIPHAEGRAGTRHTAWTVEKREESGGGGKPWRQGPMNCHDNTHVDTHEH